LLRFLVTGGEVNDITRAEALLEGEGPVGRVIGDRAYDSDAFIAHIAERGGAAVIPSRARRRVPRALDLTTYATRNVIERFFGRLKQGRRVATRYDKTACSYAGVVAVSAVHLWASGWRA
jgi:transposase